MSPTDEKDRFYVVVVVGPVDEQSMSERVADMVRDETIEGTDMSVERAYVVNQYGFPVISSCKTEDKEAN